MPIYEYACTACGTRFERLVRRFGEEVSCSACASPAVEKQLSVFAVVSSAAAPAFAGCGATSSASADAGCGPGPCGGGTCALPS